MKIERKKILLAKSCLLIQFPAISNSMSKFAVCLVLFFCLIFANFKPFILNFSFSEN